MGDNGHYYVYGTGGRDDGMAYAVGIMPAGGRANGSLALFQEREDAVLFARTRAAITGADVLILPSAEVTS